MQSLAFSVLLLVWQCYCATSAPAEFGDVDNWRQALVGRNIPELVATGQEAELLLGCANIDDMLTDILTERGMEKGDIKEILTSLQHKFAQVESAFTQSDIPKRVFKKSAAFWRPLGGLAIETRLSNMGRKMMRPSSQDGKAGASILRYG